MPVGAPTDLRDVTLAVLAGGAGSRMGRPKGTLELRGRPILDHLLDQFAWPGPTLLVTAPGREHPPGAGRFTREVADPEPGLGPLRGVLTALEHLQSPLLLVAAVDMPSVGRGQLEWYVRSLVDVRDAAGLMVTRLAAAGKVVEPLPCALRAASTALIAARLASGRRSLHGLATGPWASLLAVPAPSDWPAAVWRNLNEPGDLAGADWATSD